MTLVSQIITDAFRQGNLLAVGASPTSNQSVEALRYLNRLVKSVFGHELGEALVAVPVGRQNLVRPAGYPGYNTTPGGDWFVPKNSRLVFNLTEAVSIYLHPAPNDGSRFGVVDSSGNLSTYPATIYGNGQTIEDTASLVLNTDDLAREWFYRADLADWMRLSPLEEDDTFPFPEEFDDFFITMLAVRLNPAYGITIDNQSTATLARSERQLKARYAQHRPIASETGLIRLSKMAADRDRWVDVNDWYDPQVMFDRGYPW